MNVTPGVPALRRIFHPPVACLRDRFPARQPAFFERDGACLMPHRSTEAEHGIPLCLIPPVILKWIQAVGMEPDWIVVKRSKFHFSTNRVRSRPAKREFSRRAAALAGGTA